VPADMRNSQDHLVEEGIFITRWGEILNNRFLGVEKNWRGGSEEGREHEGNPAMN